MRVSRASSSATLFPASNPTRSSDCDTLVEPALDGFIRRPFIETHAGRVLMPCRFERGHVCPVALLLNDRVNQSPGTSAPLAMLRRTLCGCAATVRASLHRAANPGSGAAPRAMSESRPATGDRHAAQADSLRGPDGSRRAGLTTAARARVRLR